MEPTCDSTFRLQPIFAKFSMAMYSDPLQPTMSLKRYR